MIIVTRSKAVIGGVLIGLALLVLTVGPLLAQDSTAAPGGTPTGGDMSMMGAATPSARDQQMMEQCMAMMKMMMGMMGGDMSGTTGGDMGVMDAATPSAGQMTQMTEQCMAMMKMMLDMMGMMGGEGMADMQPATPTPGQ